MSSQQRVFAFLCNPATYGGSPVRCIDTHASAVFLAGDRALKVKREVRFPFLDYSTRDKRKVACEEELRINLPHAPQVYRRVLPITQRPDAALEIDGSGAPVEWALEMTRFDEDRTLDRIAAVDMIDSGLATGIADAILRSHDGATRVATTPWPATIPTLIARNTDQFRSTKAFSAGSIEALDRLSLAAFARLRERLERRATDGFVRRCHGDLHLANIALIDGDPVLFDAIEFDAAMATTDVLYDLAFTLMDLLHFGQEAAANIVLNRYLSVSPEAAIDGLSALPLFLSLRSAIRAHVLLARDVVLARDVPARAAQPAKDGQPAKVTTRRKAAAYFTLARALITPDRPELIAVGGLSGTGKSVLARALASSIRPRPGAVIIRSDVIRKRLFGSPETIPLPPSAYQPEVSVQVYDRLAELAGRMLDQGCSVIVDAAYLRESERAAIRSVARDRGVTFHGLFLQADLATRVARIGARRNDASDATAEIANLQDTYNIGALDWIAIDASDSPERTLQNSLDGLRLA